jgi:hypothetical protein
MEAIIIINAMYKHHIPWLWNHLAIPIANENAPIEAVKGHGLYSTK